MATEAITLVRSIKGDPLDCALPLGMTERLLIAAERHGVVLALRRAVGDLDEGPEIERLRTAARYLRAFALRIAVGAVEVSRCLRAAGIDHAIVKGPATAALYRDGDREFLDLDVLVSPRDMADALDALAGIGAEILDGRTWPRSDGIGELPLGLPSGVAVDLHADLIHDQRIRRRFNFPAEMVLSRTTSLQLLDDHVPIFDPEDACTYVALHAMLSGGDRLIWLADLDASVRRGAIRWPVLIERAREEHLALVVAVLLERASTVLGTPVPRPVLQELAQRGRLWSRLLGLFERLRPTAASHGQIFRGQILIRATRSSTARSFAALARLIWSEVIVFVLKDPAHPWRGRLRRWRPWGSAPSGALRGQR